jgi:putative MFS transporter
MTVLQRLERLPMARPQWRLLFQGGLGYAFDGMDAALVASILHSPTASPRSPTTVPPPSSEST